MKKFLTLVQRELWEHKTGFIILPLIFTLIVTVLLCLTFIRFAPHQSAANNASQSGLISVVSSTPVHSATSVASSASTSTNGSTNTVTSTITAADSSATSTSISTSSQSTQGISNDPNTSSLDQQFSVFSTLPIDELPLFSQINALKSSTGFVGVAMYVLSVTLVIVMLIVSLNYAHRTLFDDRKNREILFWRSMPVSETQNVATKLFMIYGLAPLVTLTMIFLGSFICWLTAMTQVSDDGVAALGIFLQPFKIYKNTLLLLLALLPLVTWSLLASAYAKKSPFMLSTFLPLGLMFADKLINGALGINLYIRTVINAYADYLAHFFRALQNGVSYLHFSTLLPVIVVSAIFVITAIWLRNNRCEI
jgi:ABC-2 type transport system permease protein